MIKSCLLFFLMFTSLNILSAQNLDGFNKERVQLNKKGMLVLGSWAIANIALSPILANSTSGTDHYFHQMNGYWNGVNLAIAGLGYYSAIKRDSNDMTISQSIEAQHKLEKTLVFNAGLDLAYIATGFYLKERANNTSGNADRLQGYGESLVLQGGFLFVF